MNTATRISLLFLTLGLSADTTLSQGGVGVDFAQFGAGARPTGMGGAYTAMADDANSAYWNPANMALVPGPELTATHTKSYLGTTFDHISGLLPMDIMGQRTSVGFYFTRAATENILITRPSDDVSGVVPSTEAGSSEADCLGIAFGRRINARLMLGTITELCRLRLLDTHASGSSLDFAVSSKLMKNAYGMIDGALVIRDLGSRLSWSTGLTETNPPVAIVGLTYSPRSAAKFAVSVDLERRMQSLPSRLETRFGLEFFLAKHLPLRFGYTEYYISTGAGFRTVKLRADYAFSLHRELAGSHRVSITLAK